jgi:hypothetical protein
MGSNHTLFRILGFAKTALGMRGWGFSALPGSPVPCPNSELHAQAVNERGVPDIRPLFLLSVVWLNLKYSPIDDLNQTLSVYLQTSVLFLSPTHHPPAALSSACRDKSKRAYVIWQQSSGCVDVWTKLRSCASPTDNPFWHRVPLHDNSSGIPSALEGSEVGGWDEGRERERGLEEA